MNDIVKEIRSKIKRTVGRIKTRDYASKQARKYAAISSDLIYLDFEGPYEIYVSKSNSQILIIDTDENVIITVDKDSKLQAVYSSDELENMKKRTRNPIANLMNNSDAFNGRGDFSYPVKSSDPKSSDPENWEHHLLFSEFHEENANVPGVTLKI